MIVLIVAALVNFGVNGIQYAIQLHLVSCGTNATLIGFISGGISLTMLVGSLLAGKLSDKVSVGPTVCLAYLFICLCALPMALTYEHAGAYYCYIDGSGPGAFDVL